MLDIRVICEGPTDFEIIRAVIDAKVRQDYRIVQLQPETKAWEDIVETCESARSFDAAVEGILSDAAS